MIDKPSKWITTLRKDIQSECGQGWMVRGIGKGHVQKVQLTFRYENNKRESIILGPKAKSDPDFVPWVGTSSGWILSICKEIALNMKVEDSNLKKAYEYVSNKRDSESNKKFTWEELAEKFKHKKTNNSIRGKRVWNRNYRTPIARILLLLSENNENVSGHSVLKKLAERYGGEPGSASRRLRIKYAAEFLRFSFQNGASRSYLPPEDLDNLIGQKQQDKR